jgi:hypothetical protein
MSIHILTVRLGGSLISHLVEFAKGLCTQVDTEILSGKDEFSHATEYDSHRPN